MSRAWPPLLGREREQLQLVSLIETLVDASLDLTSAGRPAATERPRHLEISGPPGIGKSRLTQAVVSDLVAQSRVEWLGWVDVASISDDATALDALATALGLRRAGEELESAFASRLARAASPLVLVLDHLDDLLSSASPQGGVSVGELWIARLVEAIGRSRSAVPIVVITTSSRRLVQGDRIAIDASFELGPLAEPTNEIDAANQPAIALFVAAAQHARPGFVLSPIEVPAVIGIVRALEGVPRSIELAASRMSVMGARALLQRMSQGPWSQLRSLDRACSLLVQGLDTDEQRALVAASVFRGGFTFEAAEQVIPCAPNRSLLDLIEGLRQRSLLLSLVSADGEVRLRAFGPAVSLIVAQTDLRAIEHEARVRHASYFADEATARSSERSHTTGMSRAARTFEDWVALEQENLLAALDTILGAASPDRLAAQRALAITAALGPHHVAREQGERVYARLGPLLGITRASGADPVQLAEVLLLRARVAEALGHEGAATDLVRALAMAQASSDRGLEARVSLRLGRALIEVGEIDQAQRTLEHLRSFALDARGEGELFETLGGLLCSRGETTGIELIRRSLEIARRAGDASRESLRRRALVFALIDLGDLRTAEIELDLCESSADVGVLRGLWLHDRGEVQRACVELERAAAALAEVGAHPAALRAETYAAVAYRELGNSPLAYASLTHVRDLASRGQSVLAQIHLAAVERDAGREIEADELLAQVSTRVSVSIRSVLEVEQARARRVTVAPHGVLARLAQRCALVRDAARRTDPPRQSVIPEAPASGHRATVIGPDGRWFEIADEAPVSLTRRPVLAKLLLALARRADRLVTPDELIAAGWPDERVIASAAAHRVRVAISTLRKMGLRGPLITEDDGYRLVGPVVLMETKTDGVSKTVG